MWNVSVRVLDGYLVFCCSDFPSARCISRVHEARTGRLKHQSWVSSGTAWLRDADQQHRLEIWLIHSKAMLCSSQPAVLCAAYIGQHTLMWG